MYFHDLLFYYNMKSEIVQLVGCNNYDGLYEIGHISSK